MGSCVSKCCSATANSSSGNEIGGGDVVVVVEEKLVISETSASRGSQLPCGEDISKTLQTSSFFSSSSLLLSTAHSPSVSSSSSSTCTSKQNPPRIVVIDPQKCVEFAGRITQRPKARAFRGSPPATGGSGGRPSFPSKRARSSSPNPAAGRKSLRAEPPNSAAGRKILRAEPPSSAVAGRLPSRKAEVVGARNAYNPSGIMEKKKTRVPAQQHIHQMQSRDDEVLCRSPLSEDLNNPLISMDCFIFL